MLIVQPIKQIAEEEGIPKERIQLFEAGKVITNLYSIFFLTLTLPDHNTPPLRININIKLRIRQEVGGSS